MAKKNKNKKLTFSSGTKEADDNNPKEKKGSKKGSASHYIFNTTVFLQ